MGPRPDGRGESVPALNPNSVVALQWGRDLTVAESSRHWALHAWRSVLQWGRDLTVAERPQGHLRRRLG